MNSVDTRRFCMDGADKKSPARSRTLFFCISFVRSELHDRKKRKNKVKRRTASAPLIGRKGRAKKRRNAGRRPFQTDIFVRRRKRVSAAHRRSRFCRHSVSAQIYRQPSTTTFSPAPKKKDGADTATCGHPYRRFCQTGPCRSPSFHQKISVRLWPVPLSAVRPHLP